ncbi:MAG: hypothetical protein U0840_09405 [Gemmataceae bacterium]
MEPDDLARVLSGTAALLRHAHEADSPVKPTEFYNEGWMAALTLSVAASGVDLLPFRIAQDARWWTEALLRSQFNPRRRGDRRGEGLTNADALVGHFDRRGNTKRGVRVRTDATQLICIEAKLGARLSARTDNAEGFDQAARSVACMACELDLAGVDVARCTSLAFYVLAPEDTLDFHRPLVSRDSIEARVRARVEQYDDPRRADLERWVAGPFRSVLDRLTLACVAWESVIARAVAADADRGRMLGAFYRECRRLN